ncbi:MAG: thiolase domain-containing protein [Rubrivivax sp.]|nr:thiolase domain-containing protein [Rubrivivax sp.]
MPIHPDPACIVGAFEHPTRKAPDKTVAQLHAECAAGALADAGLAKDNVDAYFCSGDAPGMGPTSMIDYLNLRVRHSESTDLGGCSYLALVAHARDAIAAGRCDVALITLAGRPRSEGHSGTTPRTRAGTPEAPWEAPYGLSTVNGYGMVAQRHMHEFGTTSEQLAWIKVAASQHAQHNPHAMLRDLVTVQDVLDSPLISDPLHRLDCCVVSDELLQLEDLGFCKKGEGGRFVADGNLISGVGRLPFNTDGGGLCNNHPANRGGMTKVIEAVRQLRGEAHPAVQVKDCGLALAQGIGGNLATRHGSATLILERQ